jgi:hypothetical protein
MYVCMYVVVAQGPTEAHESLFLLCIYTRHVYVCMYVCIHKASSCMYVCIYVCKYGQADIQRCVLNPSFRPFKQSSHLKLNVCMYVCFYVCMCEYVELS